MIHPYSAVRALLWDGRWGWSHAMGVGEHCVTSTPVRVRLLIFSSFAVFAHSWLKDTWESFETGELFCKITLCLISFSSLGNYNLRPDTNRVTDHVEYQLAVSPRAAGWIYSLWPLLLGFSCVLSTSMLYMWLLQELFSPYNWTVEQSPTRNYSIYFAMFIWAIPV